MNGPVKRMSLTTCVTGWVSMISSALFEISAKHHGAIRTPQDRAETGEKITVVVYDKDDFM